MAEGKFSSLTKLTLLKGKLKLSTMIASVERQMYYNNNSLPHINDKVKVASRVGCRERRVVYFRKLLFKSDRRNWVLEELRVKRFAVIQEEICCTAF